MTVSVQTPYTIATGNGVTTVFPFSFLLLLESDLVVKVNDVVIASAAYTVSGLSVPAGGDVTFLVAPASGAEVFIERVVPLERAVDYQYAGDLRAEVLNPDFDRLWMALQQHQTDLTRALVLPIGTVPPASTEIPFVTAGGYLRIKDDLSGFEAVTSDPPFVGADFVSNYAALRLYEGSGPVAVGGRSNYFDGAQGTFAHDSSDTTSADNDSTILVDALGRRWKRQYTNSVLPQWLGIAGDGTADDTAKIVAADAIAVAAGRSLAFSGDITCLLTSSVTFSAHVIFESSAQLKVTDSTKYIKFAAGFTAGLHYCLDTDGPTQFLYTEKIYPQWFGPCGLTAVDSSVPMRRAYRAARAGMDGVSGTTDSLFGCIKVYLIRGNYRVNEVDVYCQTITEGEVTGAVNGAYITQIDMDKDGLRVHPKNYSLTGTVLNDSNGINSFVRVTFRSETGADVTERNPQIKFYSPQQSTTLFGIAGDGIGGNVGHIDTMFEHCWFQFSAASCIKMTEGQVLLHFRDTVFDVVRQGVQWSGSAYGGAKFHDCYVYNAIRGLIYYNSTSTIGPRFYLRNTELAGCGASYNAEATWRRAIYIVAPDMTSTLGHFSMSGCWTRRISGEATFGGGIFIDNVQTVKISDNTFDDPDNTDLQKLLYVKGCKFLTFDDNTVVSRSLNSYANSRMVVINQSPQTLESGSISDNVFVNLNAGTVEAWVHSDFPVTNLHCTDNKYKGTYTNAVNNNIGGVNQRNTVRNNDRVQQYGTAAPVSGTWDVGDRIVQLTPTVGQPKAWVCTVAGTPGTWVSEGNL